MDVTSGSDVASLRWKEWHTTPWSDAFRHVRRLQTRIAKAAEHQEWRRVSRLQKLLVRSTAAKAVAVRRVTENQGRKTPGVDGITWSTPATKQAAVDTLSSRGYRPKPLRRIHIPKANGGTRPLGIPTMKDRAMQVLHWLTLDPVAETLGDANSYGFRTHRCTADAIVQCHNALSRAHSPQWILEGDIKGCFDNISHEWMLKNVPMDRRVLKKWLNAGYVEKHRLFPTEAGTPQGGPISPTLANLTLDGMEKLLDRFPRRRKVNFIRYADDFVVTGDSKEFLEQQVWPLLAKFLGERGLTLSATKTKLTHVTEGFDFLGWHVRKHKSRLLITPSKRNTTAFYTKIKGHVRKLRAAKQSELVSVLNPVLRGWGNYHKVVHASRCFGRMDHQIWQALWKWARRRHPNKGSRWVKKRYFRRTDSRDWLFETDEVKLVRLSTLGVGPHIKVRSDANPYDPKDEAYYNGVLDRQMRSTLAGRRKIYWLWKKQEGLCPVCNSKITRTTKWHVHHRVWRVFGGSDRLTNLELLHPTCHTQLHARARKG